MNNLLDLIDRDIAGKHLLRHSFYLAWVRGELTRQILADYAEQYYHHVAAFPTYLSAAHSRCDDPSTRKLLLKNLVDEEGGSPDHPQLWKNFAAAFGVTAKQLTRRALQPETVRLISTFRQICGGDTAGAVAALYAYESQIPEICESKIDGLKRHYGVRDPQHFQYFTVHLEADREHSATEREMLNRWVTDKNIEAVRRSVARVLDGLRDLLSGVCHRHAIPC